MELKEIKHSIYALRNGIMADFLRKSGDKHKYIFGVTLAQIKELASQLGKDHNMAQILWLDANNRECQMLAPFMAVADDTSEEMACQWIESVPNTEIADIVCHALLRKLPFAENLASHYACSSDELTRYTALRIYTNLLAIDKVTDMEHLSQIVADMPHSKTTDSLIQSILEDIG